jgi:hypothetical protein
MGYRLSGGLFFRLALFSISCWLRSGFLALGLCRSSLVPTVALNAPPLHFRLSKHLDAFRYLILPTPLVYTHSLNMSRDIVSDSHFFINFFSLRSGKVSFRLRRGEFASELSKFGPASAEGVGVSGKVIAFGTTQCQPLDPIGLVSFPDTLGLDP